MIENSIINDPSIPVIPKMIYVVLIQHRNRSTGDCFPSISRIQACLGISKRTVIRGLSKLEQSGLIAVEKAHRKANRYTFLGARNEPKDDSRVHLRHPAGAFETPKVVHERHPNHINEPYELTIYTQGENFESKVENIQSGGIPHGIPSLGKQLLEEWTKTLQHFGISKAMLGVELHLMRIAQQRGLDDTLAAIQGMRQESKSERFDPSKYITVGRLQKAASFERLRNLGVKAQEKLEREQAAMGTSAGLTGAYPPVDNESAERNTSTEPPDADALSRLLETARTHLAMRTNR